MRSQDGQHGLVATLSVGTPLGELHIHNVYNRNKDVEIDRLAATCMGGDSTVLLGDFNLHHELWAGAGPRRPCSKALQLERAVSNYGMKCLNQRGVVTYSRSTEESRQFCSTIDLTFASINLATRCAGWGVVDVRGFESDHRVIETCFSLSPNRTVGICYLWELVHPRKLNQHMAAALSPLGFPALETKPAIDNYTERLVESMRAVIQLEVQTARPLAVAEEPIPDHLRRQLSREREALDRFQQSPCAQTLDRWMQDRAASDGLMRRLRLTSWRRYLAEGARRRGAVFKLAKRAVRWCRPREPPCMPDVIVGDVIYKTADAKARCMVETLWPSFSEESEPPHVPPPDPPLATDPVLESPQELEAAELREVFKNLRRGRSALPDYVGNEALKMCEDACFDYVEHLFRACIKLSYHPLHFRHAVTVMLRKPGKASYSHPKSWRPVALLSCLGKMLEKLMANRLKELVARYHLLPDHQFAAAGRCTSKCLQYLLNIVYRSWCFAPRSPRRIYTKRVTSMLSLDIQGAFDRVPWALLLRRLVGKGIPYWIVLYIWTLLRCRSTIISLPNYNSAPFWLTVGIPQGSPLSPILFQLFAAGLLEVLDAQDRSEWRSKTIDVFSFGYVDDHYLVVTSPSYQTNCRVLERMHDALMSWAVPNSVVFAPSKYAVMHFRRPQSHSPGYESIPRIEGLTQAALKRNLRVLGVEIDDRLGWGPHVEVVRRRKKEKRIYHETVADAAFFLLTVGRQIQARVRQAMKKLKRISGSVWGVGLERMRQLYLAKIRPIMSYGCGAWFVRSGDASWQFPSRLVKQLESIQYRCLLQVSGAMAGTSHAVLRQELSLESVEVFLNRVARVHRARMVHTPEFRDLEATRTRPLWGGMRDSKAMDRHPYFQLHKEAIALEEEAYRALEDEASRAADGLAPGSTDTLCPKRRARSIRTCAAKRAKAESTERWNEYRDLRRRERPGDSVPLAMRQPWGAEAFRHYRDLTRAQSTMLLQCRTERIGLRAFLYSHRVDPAAVSAGAVPRSPAPPRRTTGRLKQDS